jgi:hypothetical protein
MKKILPVVCVMGFLACSSAPEGGDDANLWEDASVDVLALDEGMELSDEGILRDLPGEDILELVELVEELPETETDLTLGEVTEDLPGEAGDPDTPEVTEDIGGDILLPVEDMVLIPGGSFTMGTESGTLGEGPAHSVTLSPFWMDRAEVTRDDYALCVEAGVCTSPKCTLTLEGTRPVECTDWTQARTFCDWRGARLPTEAEWERAAQGLRGGLYPWGSGAPSCSLAVSDPCGEETLEVCSLPGGDTDEGLCDMAGNVSEWVMDWYSDTYYSESSGIDPQGPEKGARRVIRGGGYRTAVGSLKTTDRASRIPGVGSPGTGFRCARAGSGEGS